MTFPKTFITASRPTLPDLLPPDLLPPVLDDGKFIGLPADVWVSQMLKNNIFFIFRETDRPE